MHTDHAMVAWDTNGAVISDLLSKRRRSIMSLCQLLDPLANDLLPRPQCGGDDVLRGAHVTICLLGYVFVLSVLVLLEIDTMPWRTELGGTFWCSQKTKPNWVRPVVFLEYFRSYSWLLVKVNNNITCKMSTLIIVASLRACFSSYVCGYSNLWLEISVR
jgi:hypothetical protein